MPSAKTNPAAKDAGRQSQSKPKQQQPSNNSKSKADPKQQPSAKNSNRSAEPKQHKSDSKSQHRQSASGSSNAKNAQQKDDSNRQNDRHSSGRSSERDATCSSAQSWQGGAGQRISVADLMESAKNSSTGALLGSSSSSSITVTPCMTRPAKPLRPEKEQPESKHDAMDIFRRDLQSKCKPPAAHSIANSSSTREERAPTERQIHDMKLRAVGGLTPVKTIRYNPYAADVLGDGMTHEVLELATERYWEAKAEEQKALELKEKRESQKGQYDAIVEYAVINARVQVRFGQPSPPVAPPEVPLDYCAAYYRSANSSVAASTLNSGANSLYGTPPPATPFLASDNTLSPTDFTVVPFTQPLAVAALNAPSFNSVASTSEDRSPLFTSLFAPTMTEDSTTDEEHQASSTPGSSSSCTTPSHDVDVTGTFVPQQPRAVSVYSYFRDVAIGIFRRQSENGQYSVSQVTMMNLLNTQYPLLTSVCTTLSRKPQSVPDAPVAELTPVAPIDPESGPAWERPLKWEQWFTQALGVKKFFYKPEDVVDTLLLSPNEARLTWKCREAHAFHDLGERDRKGVAHLKEFVWQYYHYLLEQEDLNEGTALTSCDNMWPTFIRLPLAVAFFENNSNSVSKSEVKSLMRELGGGMFHASTLLNRDVPKQKLFDAVTIILKSHRTKEARADDRKDSGNCRLKTRRSTEKMAEKVSRTGTPDQPSVDPRSSLAPQPQSGYREARKSRGMVSPADSTKSHRSSGSGNCNGLSDDNNSLAGSTSTYPGEKAIGSEKRQRYSMSARRNNKC